MTWRELGNRKATGGRRTTLTHHKPHDLDRRLCGHPSTQRRRDILRETDVRVPTYIPYSVLDAILSPTFCLLYPPKKAETIGWRWLWMAVDGRDGFCVSATSSSPFHPSIFYSLPLAYPCRLRKHMQLDLYFARRGHFLLLTPTFHSQFPLLIKRLIVGYVLIVIPFCAIFRRLQIDASTTCRSDPGSERGTFPLGAYDQILSG